MFKVAGTNSHSSTFSLFHFFTPMSSKTVLTSPNAELRVISKKFPTKEITSKKAQELVRDLIETMRVENGIGIAAPQIGVHKRLIIVDVGENQPQAFFNPKILSKSFTKTEISPA